ncbi:hypothetical protein BC831DRAFT_487196 [Entophlyctis helioformis]|nr:hypothetical protein BC831DRAFT_487196 [Entophlyctis helioformis]
MTSIAVTGTGYRPSGCQWAAPRSRAAGKQPAESAPPEQSAKQQQQQPSLSTPSSAMAQHGDPATALDGAIDDQPQHMRHDDRDGLAWRLEEAALDGSPHAFQSAFDIQRERQALADRANELRAMFEADISRGSRRIRPKLEGVLVDSCMDDDDRWRAFQGVQEHEYELENPSVSDEFFDVLQGIMTAHDLEGIDPEVIQNSFPWLMARAKSGSHDLFDHPLLHKAKPVKKQSVKSAKKTATKAAAASAQPPKPSIVKRRFEEDMAARENKIREELNSKFQANPVPASSLIPKFNLIMTIRDACAKCRALTQKGKRVTCKCETEINPLVKEALAAVEREQKAKKRAEHSSRLMIMCASESGDAIGDCVPRVTETAVQDGKKRRARMIGTAGLTQEHTFQPRITGAVPDFKALQEQFYKRLEGRKQMRGGTQPMPFNGLESHEQERAKRIEERAKRADELHARRTGSTESKPTVLNPKLLKPVHTKPTHSWKLRVEHLQMQKDAQKLIEEMEEQERLEKEERNRVFSFKIRARIDKSAAKEIAERTETKRRHFVEDQKKRTMEYIESIQDMNKRISSRMCLFEQEQIDMAKRKATTGAYMPCQLLWSRH